MGYDKMIVDCLEEVYCILIVFEFPLNEDLSLSARASMTAVTFAVLPLVYGFLGKLLLQPVQGRLEVIAEKSNDH